MKILFSILNELKKNIFNSTFFFSVIFIALLCFASGIYTDEYAKKSYSIIEVLIHFDYNFIKSNYDFSSLLVFEKGINEYLMMFMPILTSISFIRSFCAEINSTFYRYEICRIGKSTMALSKFVGGMLSGGLAALIGILLFGIIIICVFPSINSYQIDPILYEILLGEKGSLAIILNILAGSFLYGMFSSMLSILLSIIIQNFYVSICLPFMITYMYTMTLNKLILSENILYNSNLVSILQILYPHSVIYFFNGSLLRFSILVNVAIMVLEFIIYYNVTKRRID